MDVWCFAYRVTLTGGEPNPNYPAIQQMEYKVRDWAMNLASCATCGTVGRCWESDWGLPCVLLAFAHHLPASLMLRRALQVASSCDSGQLFAFYCAYADD